MVPGFHGFDLIVILLVALLIFGPKRLPEMGSAIGKSIREFRKGMSDLTKDKEEHDPLDEPFSPSYAARNNLNRLSSGSTLRQDQLFEPSPEMVREMQPQSIQSQTSPTSTSKTEPASSEGGQKAE
ncbi:Sec-independent protein translocase subunit TatA/TatB [Thermogemmatispora sp.]|uniref:Sec-independent protein translocase subunit TatA/TatB n=1 Tax=Thermogemmatispora sp. TaxID=1968838 RepID=UPI001D425050|nr:twin-arginine translocase TatA/TatE family subunit [Thermogemmatispora sp.]MBX5449754.1 twin-arginine translocase TatA/TatE family subunit [Thermogemmatispora sp.]